MYFLKSFITILLTVLFVTAVAQPTKPILRIENGMHTARGLRIAAPASGKWLLTCSDDKTARLWDATNGILLHVFRIPVGETKEGKIYSCSLSPDGKIVALGGSTGFDWDKAYSIYLLNTQTGHIVHRIKGLPSVINDLEFSADGKWLAAGLGDSSGVRIFDTRAWTEVKKLEGYRQAVFNIAFKPTGGLASVCFDGTIRMYDGNFELLAQKSGLAGKLIYSLAFNPSGDLLAVGYQDAAIEVRNAADLSLLYKPSYSAEDSQNGIFYVVSFSADGSRLYGGGNFYKLNKDSSWKLAVRSWNDAGRGAYEDLPLMSNGVMDIKPLPGGSMAILGAYPDMAVTGSSNTTSWYLSSGNNDYAANDGSYLKVSANGSVIGFAPQYPETYSFDVSKRKLLEGEVSYPSFSDTVAGTIVTNWKQDPNPRVNGKKISFLSKNEQCFSTDINSDGKLVVLGGSFKLYGCNNNAEMLWETNLPGFAIAVNICGNDKMVVAILSDGSIRWYSMADGKEILTFYLHEDKKRWALFTPSGYYDASPGAEDFLGWHMNNGPDDKPSFYPISRFREEFYRPDIIDAIFETFNESMAISIANQRIGKKGAALQATDITKKQPPVISISNPPNGSDVMTDTVIISYTMKTPPNAPAKNIKVLVNGRPVSIERGIIIGSSGNQKAVVKIPRKDCIITLLSENDNGTSPEANLVLKWKGTDDSTATSNAKPNLYILAIGISKYNKPDYQLGLAAKDASDFSSAILLQKGGLYHDVIIKKLTDADATKENILKGMQWIQEKTTGNDIAMIFYAGHGINDKNNLYYILPVNADIEKLPASCINSLEIKMTQSTIKGKVIIFIDACHSGNIMGAGDNYINGMINQLTSTVKGAGAITFTSSTDKEYSLENPDWGNGAFTKALVEGLNGAAAFVGEKEISYGDLSAYLSRQVKRITNDKQHPTMVPTPNTPDFPVAIKQ